MTTIINGILIGTIIIFSLFHADISKKTVDTHQPGGDDAPVLVEYNPRN